MSKEQKQNPFSLIPYQVFLDDRLSKTDLRVLGAILSYRNVNTNLCYPSREQIRDRCGLQLCKISTATSNLSDLGWLKKIGNGGRSSHCTYEFTADIAIRFMQETVTDSVTVSDSVTVTDSVTKTVTDSVTKTVTDSVTKTVTDSVRGNKQTIEQTIKQTNKHTIGKNDKSDDLFFDVTEQTKADFKKLRLAKKAPITERAMSAIRSEAEKAGISLETALIECCARGWTGFKADWYLKSSHQPGNVAHTANRSEYSKQQTELAKQRLFGKIFNEKDVTNG